MAISQFNPESIYSKISFIESTEIYIAGVGNLLGLAGQILEMGRDTRANCERSSLGKIAWLVK